jgi:hypothetical protein
MLISSFLRVTIMGFVIKNREGLHILPEIALSYNHHHHHSNTFPLVYGPFNPINTSFYPPYIVQENKAVIRTYLYDKIVFNKLPCIL